MPARRGAPAGGGLDEGVDAEDLGPLLQEAAVLVAVAVAVALPSGRAARWRVGIGVGRVEGSAGRGEGRGKAAGRGVVHADHVLVGGHGPRHLDELNEEQHEDPGELESGPDRQDQCICVSVNDLADACSEEVALVRGRSRSGCKVCTKGQNMQ